MMLYVFHVDVGRMLSFDMTVALNSVENLKETIQRLHGIPATNIVLLVSGGEMLTQSTQVSYYSAGTDTNPIYMFLTGDDRLPPTLPSCDGDIELRRQVEESHKLPAILETVRQRAQLALQMRDLARKEEQQCERLVHEQHLQQQGWSAVVANMEDVTNEFCERFDNFCLAFDRHLQKRDSYLELVRNFPDDLKKLARIPILPGLMGLAEADFHGFDELLDNDDVFLRSQQQQLQQQQEQQKAITNSGGNQAETQQGNEIDPTTLSGDGDVDKSSTSPNKKLKMGNDVNDDTNVDVDVDVDVVVDEQQPQVNVIADVETEIGAGAEPERISQASTSSSSLARRANMNLLQWITSKGNHNALQVMSDECVQGLETFNVEIYEKLKLEVQQIIKLAKQSEVKEIKGLSDRLCRLEEFKYKIKKMEQDQREQATAFQQNEARALNLRDNSVLPDLCLSHKSQLQVMLDNHLKIRDYCRCINNSKDELGKNLHTRLKRIVFIENNMSEFDNRLLFHHRCMRRAERHVNIIEQIHRAPSTYMAAVTEVVRRKIFSNGFRLWASRLAVDFDRIHGEELQRRQEFNANFDGHFLNILFPGMGDMPPTFANEHVPLNFDSRLPHLTRSDIDALTSYLPEIAPEVQLPDMGPVIDFFISRSGDQQRERMEQLLRQQVAATLELLEKPPTVQHQRLSELQAHSAGCDESETDTETEFEKVAEVAAAPMTVSVGTSTTTTQQHQLQQQEQQTDEVRVELIARSTATEQLLMLSASTLTEENASSHRAELERLRDALNAMSKLAVECLRTARSNIASFRRDAGDYQNDLQSDMQQLHDTWNVLRMQNEAREKQAIEETHTLSIKCATLEAQLEEIRDQLKAAQLEKQAAVAEAREELIHEHKTEIESLRCRFKLMTSMERSPSDCSLEKIERPTSSASMSGDAIDQLLQQQRMELDAQRERAVAEAVEMERSLWQSRIYQNSESVMANVTERNILKDMLEDKERQLDLLREENKLLNQENFQLKTRLDALTNEEGNSWLKEKIDYLSRDKNRLEEELNQERNKNKRLEMETSVAPMRGSTLDQSGALTRSKSSGFGHRYVVLEGCQKGDLVFVVWSMRHAQFMVVQDSMTLYFVHGESVAALQLNPPTSAQMITGDGGGVGVGAIVDANQIPLPYYAIGRVTDKEYCQARKDENRYRVTRGSKFYRIKLAPLPKRTSMRRDRLESISSASSRAINDSPPTLALTIAQQQQQQQLSQSPLSRNVIDASATTTVGSSSSTIVHPSCKERTVSISSVFEEDDESASLLSERCRFISISDEELLAVASAATTAVVIAPQIQQQQQQQQHQQLQLQQQQQPQSVITEQPTASSKLKLDLLLASADIVTEPLQQIDLESTLVTSNLITDTDATTTTTTTTTTTIHDTNTNDTHITTTTTTTIDTTIDPNANPTIATTTTNLTDNSVLATNTTGTPTLTTTTTTTPPPPLTATSCNIGENVMPIILPESMATTISEDSDEYRSLEGKDESDFPIFE